MASYYPLIVDTVKPTYGGLPKTPHNVKFRPMETPAYQYVAIGLRLRAIRAAFSDLGQQAWAEKHNFSHTQYNNWERGDRRIPVESAEKLCVYGLTLDFIYRGRRDGLSEIASKVL